MQFSAPIVDTHTHTHYSDGIGEIIDNVYAARDAGCVILCATDHLTLPPQGFHGGEEGVSAEMKPQLEADIARAREEVPEVELVYGYECDWCEGCESYIPEYSEGATFRLGSVHYLDLGDLSSDGKLHCIDGTDMEVYEKIGANAMWKAYAEAWCKACASPLHFDTMAHPDLAMRYAREGWHVTCDLTDIFRTMAECAHDTGRHIEVSTAALRKGVGTYYPNHELLMLFCQAGVPITVGSDGHTPGDIARDIRGAYAYAYSAGYRSFDCPRIDGSWTTFEL